MTDKMNVISDELLTAYVDGELDQDQASEIAKALTYDPLLRNKSEGLIKTKLLLEENLSVSGESTPKHIADRIDRIVANSVPVPQYEKWYISIVEFFNKYFQLRYSIPTAAAFALGIMVSPPLVNQSEINSNRDYLLRGGDDVYNSLEQGLVEYLQVSVTQDGTPVPDGTAISSQQLFTVAFKAPFDGTASLSEVINAEDRPVIESRQAGKSSFVTFNPLAVTDQEQVSLKLSIFDESQSVSVIISFEVTE